MMGEIRKRGGVYWIRWYRNGQRFEESARTRKHDEARDLLKKREGDVAKGAPVSAKMGRLKFDEAAADLETDYRINGKKSISHVERHVKQLTKWFGGRRMSELTGADVRKYVEARQVAGAANATINRELAALRRAFTLAVDGGKLIAKPKITMLQENNARQGFFEREQFVSVLARLSPALKAVATFAYYTGWRRSEILKLDWQRVDRKAGIVRLDVGTTKNKDGREFYYKDLEDMRTMMEGRWTERERMRKAGTIVPLVFHRNGKEIKSYRKGLLAACKAAGCPGRLMHDFRRTAVRNLERAGVSRSVAMKLTGHKTESVFRRYAIVSSGDLADASRKLQAMTIGTISGTIGQSDTASEAQKASA
jgi:integrase